VVAGELTFHPELDRNQPESVPSEAKAVASPAPSV
jgi:hypothetical protein